jgi:hypothetical protein
MSAFAQDWSALMTTPPTDMTPSRDEIDYKLDHLLAQWYAWRREYRWGRGHKSGAVTRDYQTPTHYDWHNGAADARAEDLVNRQVEECVELVPNTPERWRTAIEFEAMNLVTGAQVWHSSALPADKEAREVLVLQARNMLLRELMRAGVMT